MNKLAFIYLNRKYLGNKIAADLDPRYQSVVKTTPYFNPNFDPRYVSVTRTTPSPYGTGSITTREKNPQYSTPKSQILANQKEIDDLTDSIRSDLGPKVSTAPTAPTAPTASVTPKLNPEEGLSLEKQKAIVAKYPQIGIANSEANRYFVEGHKGGVRDYEELASIASDPNREFVPGQADAISNVIAQGKATPATVKGIEYNGLFVPALNNARDYRTKFKSETSGIKEDISDSNLRRPFNISAVSPEALRSDTNPSDATPEGDTNLATREVRLKSDNSIKTNRSALFHEVPHVLTVPAVDPSWPIDPATKQPMTESQALSNYKNISNDKFRTRREGETMDDWTASNDKATGLYNEAKENYDTVSRLSAANRKLTTTNGSPEVSGLTDKFDKYLLDPHESETRRAKMSAAFTVMGNKQPATPEEGAQLLSAFGIGAPGQPKPLIKAKAFQYLKENSDVQDLVDLYNRMSPEQQKQVYAKWSGEQGGLVKNENGLLPSTTRPLLQNNADFQRRMTA